MWRSLRRRARAAAPATRTARWSGGTCACSRAWARSSCASSTCRPAWRTPRASPRWCTRSRVARRRRRSSAGAPPRRWPGPAFRRRRTASTPGYFPGRLRPVREAATELLDGAPWRGRCPGAGGVERMLREGTGATSPAGSLQRARGMTGFARSLADETARPLVIGTADLLWLLRRVAERGHGLFLARRRRARSSSWRTRSLESPRRRPVSRSALALLDPGRTAA